MRAPALARTVIACSALLLLLPRLAAAQTRSPVDVEAADRLYASAKAAMERGDLRAACPQFAESQRLDPAAGTLLNLGECEARSGKLATGLGHFEAARATLAPGDYRLAFADERIAQLTRTVPRLAVRWRGTVGPGTRVLRDGVDVAASTLGAPLPVDPGVHQVIVRENERVVARAEVTVSEGQVETADLVPSGEGAGATEDARARTPSTQRTVGLLAIGAGGLSFGVGVVFGIVAKLTYDSASSASNCPSGTASCDGAGVSGGQTAHTQAAIATGTIVAGLGVAAGGLALVILAPKSTAVAVTPSVGAGGAGLSVGGAW